MLGQHVLDGVKLVEFGTGITVPLFATYLADHGAIVVKVESLKKVDILRTTFPYTNNIPGVNRSAIFTPYNNGKYSLALNLEHPEGLEVAKRLISWSDITAENFTSGTMEKWGLTYQEITKFKPDIIMVRSSMQGQWGPRATHPGLGTGLQALMGFTRLLGWPDRPPVGPPVPYTDYMGPVYLTAAVVCALERRRRTGKGLYIDMSQFEAALSFLSPALLDYTANSRVQHAAGNHCPYAAPHNAYRCRGDDRWCAIAVFTDQEWEALCQAIGEPGWCKDSKFATSLGRKKNEDELDRLIEQWTVNYPAEDVMESMQARGVAAGILETGEDLYRDPQLEQRQHFQYLAHPEMGVTAYDMPSFRLSRTPAKLTAPAPCLGEHTEYVCRDMLGMSDEEFLRLLQAGVLE